MLKHHHITLSRTVGSVVFAVFLVLTPRTWGDAESADSAEIPLESLQEPEACQWCVPETRDCEAADTEAPAFWINPDKALPTNTPCVQGVESDSPSS